VTWPRWNLQLFKQPPGEQTAINNANTANTQLDQASMQLISEWTGIALPQVQKLYPMLQSTIAGGATPMARAAQAPVAQQTSRAIGQISTNLGGVTNPNALIKDVTLQGQGAAGLAEDNTISQALTAINSLIGGQASLAGAGIGGVGEAARNETGIAQILANQPSPFQQIMGGIGDLAGLYFGLSSGGALGGAIGGGGGGLTGNSPGTVYGTP
jgi:hypothetical protein